MSDQTTDKSNAATQGAGAADDNNQPIFSIEKIYVRDLSLEVPNAPGIYLERGKPKVSVELNNQGNKVSDGIYEVALTVNVAARLEDERTMFMVEVVQCGLFQLRNIPEAEMEPALMIGCPNILFPYARETVSDALTRAGFQPVLLNPVNFEAMYRSRKQREQEQNASAQPEQ